MNLLTALLTLLLLGLAVLGVMFAFVYACDKV